MAHVPLGAVRNTIDAIKKRLKSLHRGTGGKAVNGRCFRAVTLPHSQTQTPNFTATQSRCGSRLQDGEDVPNGATLRRGAAVRDTCAELFDSVDCIIGTKWRKKNERGLPPRRARSGQRGKRSREYDRSTKSDRQIASTTKPRSDKCGTARQRPHFPLYKSQHQERCRRKAALNTKKAVYSSRTDG